MRARVAACDVHLVAAAAATCRRRDGDRREAARRAVLNAALREVQPLPPCAAEQPGRRIALWREARGGAWPWWPDEQGIADLLYSLRTVENHSSGSAN
jgi:hypothetical protein